MIDMVRLELKDKNIGLSITKRAKKYLGEKGFDPLLGARPLRRLIQDEIEDALSEDLLGGKLKEGDTAKIDFKKNGLQITTEGSGTVPVPTG